VTAAVLVLVLVAVVPFFDRPDFVILFDNGYLSLVAGKQKIIIIIFYYENEISFVIIMDDEEWDFVNAVSKK
jgi:hypothetical protein